MLSSPTPAAAHHPLPVVKIIAYAGGPVDNLACGCRRRHDHHLADADKGFDSGRCAKDLLQGAVVGHAGMPAKNMWVPAGFMITNWLMRTRGMTLAVALKTFADHRPAGIYKEDYIRALYKYYHEPL